MASKSQTRALSPKTSSRRPKLMRASATAPSLATSNASRQDLASLQNSRAATLLTTLASYSTHHSYEHARRTSDGSMCSSPGQSPESAMAERRETFEEVLAAQSNYFSFPSFEDFKEYQQDQERRESRQENGVP